MNHGGAFENDRLVHETKDPPRGQAEHDKANYERRALRDRPVVETKARKPKAKGRTDG